MTGSVVAVSERVTLVMTPGPCLCRPTLVRLAPRTNVGHWQVRPGHDTNPTFFATISDGDSGETASCCHVTQ